MTEENTAKAIGKDLPISTKISIEVCNFIRGMPVQKAKIKLNDAINQTAAIPYKRFTRDLGHKRNIMAGRYPRNVCTYVLKLINLAEANAKNIGLKTDNLVINKLIANKAARPWRYGRTRRIKMKRTHLEIAVSEGKK